MIQFMLILNHHSMLTTSTSLLKRLANITLVLVYLVILAGAVVRATGSGMGCPDWPKCFGKLIPPTDSLSLPQGYRQLYVEKRKAKNERMSKVLRFFGADDLADKLLKDPSIYTELDFNVTKAWIEYVNRLFGVALGFAQLALVIVAWRFRKEKKNIFLYSFLALLLTIFEGWLGSIVVSTNLLPWTITVHMLLALGIMVFVTSIIVKIKSDEIEKRNSFSPLIKNILLFAAIISLVQIVLGTQVREQIDNIATRIDDRNLWVAQLDHWFPIHQLLAFVVLTMNGYLFLILRKSAIEIKRFANYLIAIIILEMAAGLLLSTFSLPKFIQPVHLMLAVFMFGFQMSLYFRIKRALV